MNARIELPSPTVKREKTVRALGDFEPVGEILRRVLADLEDRIDPGKWDPELSMSIDGVMEKLEARENS